MKQRAALVAIVLAVMALRGVSAQAWADFATVSMTNPTTPKLSVSRLCYTDGTDLACDGAAGLLTTSGTLQISNVSATNAVTAPAGGFGNLAAGNVSATGNVSAVKFIGDGSGLTGISAGASGDRITCGTASVIANSTGGYVSLTTGAVTWAISAAAPPTCRI